MKIQTGQHSLQGRRDENQDACGVARTRWGVVAAVCDGLGGHEGGQQAAFLAMEAVVDAVPSAPNTESAEQFIRRAVRTAHQKVRDRQRGPLVEMQTTIVVWAWRPASPSVCAVGHLGDSRAYLYRPSGRGNLVQLTEDHAAGRHAVTRTVGERGDARTGEPEVRTFACLPGDTFLLCSDGLHGTLSNEMIRGGLSNRQKRSPGFAAEGLCQWALHMGSQDNITAVVLRLTP